MLNIPGWRDHHPAPEGTMTTSSTSDPPDELLTGQQVGKLTKLPPKSILNMAARNELPHVRVSARRIRFRRSDIDAYLDRQRTSARRERPKLDADTIAFLAELAAAASALTEEQKDVIRSAFRGGKT